MSEAEEILSRMEASRKSFRGAFCLSMVGLAALVAASVIKTVPDVIRTKGMQVVDGKDIVGVADVYNHKLVIGTLKGSSSLASLGEDSIGGGTIVLSGPTGKEFSRIGTIKTGGGSISINGPEGVEIANMSPNVTNAGSLFIDNAAGVLVGEINGDKQNGGAIIVHDAQGKETGRVHQ